MSKIGYIWLPLLRLNPPTATEKFPWDDLRKIFLWMSTDDQGTKQRRKIAENFNRLTGWVGCTNVTDRQTTDVLRIAYGERERKFRLAKNRLDKNWINQDVVCDYKSELIGIRRLPVCT